MQQRTLFAIICQTNFRENTMACMAFLTVQMEIGRVAYYQCAAGSLRKARPASRNIELEMIMNGWAWVIKQYTFDREAEYFEAQPEAITTPSP